MGVKLGPTDEETKEGNKALRAISDLTEKIVRRLEKTAQRRVP
jgi:hypothetical protein